MAKRHVQTKQTVNAPTMVSNIQPVKGMFGEKRIADLEKAVRNRNRRIKEQVKKLAGEYNQENYAKLARSGYLPSQMKVDFSKVTSIKDYNMLMRMLTADKSKQWKEMRVSSMRNWMKSMVTKTTYIDKKMDPELFAKINSMSEKDIIRFRNENKDLVSDFFEWYKEPAIDVDERNWLWDSIRKSLGMEPLEDKPMMFAL